MIEKFIKFYGRIVDLIPEITLGTFILIVAFILAMLIRRLIIRRISPYTKNPLLVNFIGKIIALTVNIIGIISFLGIIGLGHISSNILTGAGIITFVIGFAFKDIGENFLSGIILAFKSPFSVHDFIETDKTIGSVSEVNLRATVIKTADGKDVFVPNSQILKNPLINYTFDGYLRNDFVLGFDVKSDILLISDLIMDCLIKNECILQEENRNPSVLTDDLQDKKINLRIYYWIDTEKYKTKNDHLLIKSNLLNSISNALTENSLI